jgi:YesN/AraC family two-component response regulator
MVVKDQLKRIGLNRATVKLGEVEIDGAAITDAQLNQFRTGLFRFGLEVLDDKKTLLIDKIKKVIIELVHYEDEPLKINFSAYLSEKLNYEYTYLANLFSEVEGINVEHYLITHKIERVKELLIYEGFTLTEISYKLNYSSVAHLCNQFKKITGTTPSDFKKSRDKHYLQTA